MIEVNVCTIAGARYPFSVDEAPCARELYSQAAEVLHLHRFKLVLRGNTLEEDDSTVQLQPGDTLLAVPQRRAPSQRIRQAAAEASGAVPDTDDEPIRFVCPPGVYVWESRLASFLQRRCRVPDLALCYLYAARPSRLLLGAGLVAASPLAHRLGLGPVYVLAIILLAMLTNLGRRRDGEASAYSVFNEGVARLPGQLDADDLDQQMRRGNVL